MEIGEGSKQPKIIEIIAPEFLEKGQNLFDQEPFRNVCLKLQESLVLEQNQAQKILGAFSNRDMEYKPLSTPTLGFAEKTREEQEEILFKYARKVKYYANIPRAQLPLDDIDKAVRIIFRTLYQYPFWSEYFDQKMNEGGEYNRDGKQRDRSVKYVPEESYGKWVSNKLKYEENSIIKGIEEVFPSIESSLGSGSSASRRWKFLQASELVSREKR